MTRVNNDIDPEDSHVRLSLWQFGSILVSIIGGTLIVGGLLWTIRLDINKLSHDYQILQKDLARIEGERAQVVREWTEWRNKVEARNEQQNLDIRVLQTEHLKNGIRE
jgi:hypothetical protein